MGKDRFIVVIEISDGVIQDVLAAEDFEAVIVHDDTGTDGPETWFDCGRVDPDRVAEVLAEREEEGDDEEA